jgi:hypothetical protein
MQRRTKPAKIEVGTMNEDAVILPIAHFVWNAEDKYEWTPDLVISSTGWGIFTEYPEFLAKLGSLNGIVLHPDMMLTKLRDMGCVEAQAADYQDDFVVSEVFADPDLVGSSEYRAIYDLLEDAEDWSDARATIGEFKEQAASMLRTIDDLMPDV